jgi:large subunit ribosomal protein L32e
MKSQNRIKKKMKFSRQDSHKKKKLGDKWRRPKGLHSKMRLQKKGYKKIVKKGYGKDNKTKHLIDGMKKVFVNNLKQLKNIDKKTEGIIISSKLGAKKRIEIIKQAEKDNIKILNIKDTKDFVKKIEEKRIQEKERKAEKKKEKDKKKKEKPKKEKKLEKEVEKEMDEEEKKKEQKKEKDKVLTKKE